MRRWTLRSMPRWIHPSSRPWIHPSSRPWIHPLPGCHSSCWRRSRRCDLLGCHSSCWRRSRRCDLLGCHSSCWRRSRRSRPAEVLAKKANKVRMLEPPRDRRFPLERSDGVPLTEPVRSQHLHRDLAEQLSVPRVEDLVPGAGLLCADHNEGLVDLVAAPQPPARFHGGRHGKHRARSLPAGPEKQLLEVGQRGPEAGDEEQSDHQAGDAGHCTDDHIERP